MAKNIHEIRDPIHNFIRLDSNERKVLDSRPFQRLRYIHQLGLTYLLYPGATHRRFEHSLGVMELARKHLQNLPTDGNKANDTFMTIVQTAKKLGVSSYEYIHDRFSKSFCMPSLSELIEAKKIAEINIDAG